MSNTTKERETEMVNILAFGIFADDWDAEEAAKLWNEARVDRDYLRARAAKLLAVYREHIGSPLASVPTRETP